MKDCIAIVFCVYSTVFCVRACLMISRYERELVDVSVDVIYPSCAALVDDVKTRVGQGYTDH